jgi:hypothetical protein
MARTGMRSAVGQNRLAAGEHGDEDISATYLTSAPGHAA